jgi:hypothetical protein
MPGVVTNQAQTPRRWRREIAALVARASSVSLVEPIPTADRKGAMREGWIANPAKGRST